MAKSKKNKKEAQKPSVKVQDLEPEQDPKGGAYLKYDKYATALKLTDKTAVQLPGSLSTYKIHK